MTEDGFIISIARIPGSIHDAHIEGLIDEQSRPPVVLVHGLGQNMMQWVINSPEKSQALILANAGYDVWMPNSRGTYFSL